MTLAKALGVSAGWLATGEGSPTGAAVESPDAAESIPVSANAEKLIHRIHETDRARRLTDAVTEAILSMLNAAQGMPATSEPNGATGSRLINVQEVDLDLLQQILDGQEQLREEFQHAMRTIRVTKVAPGKAAAPKKEKSK